MIEGFFQQHNQKKGIICLKIRQLIHFIGVHWLKTMPKKND